MKIAIVEDEKAEAKELERLLVKYSKKRNITFQKNYFSSAEEFLGVYKSDYDLIFMDILLETIDGMTAAEKIRELDQKVIIVFITSMVRYAVKGYSVNALDFIVKPITEQALNVLMDKVLKAESLRRNEFISIKTKADFIRMPVSKIMYIEVNRHRISYHTTEGEYSTWGTMKDVEDQFPDGRFSRCNVCYLVNLVHVSAVEGENIVVGEERLKISRPKRKKFLEDLAYFWGAGGK